MSEHGYSGNDRRQFPRVDVPSDELVRLDVRRTVRLLDISHSGALLACEPGLASEAHGRLSAGLGTRPFQAKVAVRRYGGKAVPLGAVGLVAEFIAMDHRSRQHLLQFLRRSSD